MAFVIAFAEVKTSFAVAITTNLAKTSFAIAIAIQAKTSFAITSFKPFSFRQQIDFEQQTIDPKKGSFDLDLAMPFAKDDLELD